VNLSQFWVSGSWLPFPKTVWRKHNTYLRPGPIRIRPLGNGSFAGSFPYELPPLLHSLSRFQVPDGILDVYPLPIVTTGSL
jgi:hypothetical protein